MLELPEAFAISAQLKNELLREAICKVVVNQSPHKFAWYFENPQAYEGRMLGLKVTDVIPIAGQVEIQFEEMRLVLSDGVNIRLYEAKAILPPKHQLLIQFESGKCLVFSVQMYGGLMAFGEGENQNPYYLVAKAKPSPLTDAFNLIYFKQLVQNEQKNPSLKAFLATEQRIPGLGNGVLQDILYEAGMHPKRKLKSLSDTDIKTLYDSVKGTLKVMTDSGGRDTEKDLYGKPCGYLTKLSSKTQDEPCYKCGDIFHKEAYMGGSIYYCATCQPINV